MKDAARQAIDQADLDRSGIQNVIHNARELQSAVIPVMVEALKRLAKMIVFRLRKISDARTTEELVLDGKYNYADAYINSANFPARVRRGRAAEIVFIEGGDFDHDPTAEEVLVEAAKRGLPRPRYEDGLYFGVEHPGVQREAPVVFLHEPIVLDGLPRVLCLWGRVGYRGLYLDYFTGGWSRYCRFAFVRK
ncbi:MAG: hypothetical protein A3I89_00750 [Candidatus Harrisonbacteria bacterium RIFCSPLOWO2_02_FULL_41_11]|nr:MAG: hypothetical protein A3I89_00750 [Candidatus Harrisonbacteria bacterium RIFCSPLOWO2_02_FULL_41_11]